LRICYALLSYFRQHFELVIALYLFSNVLFIFIMNSLLLGQINVMNFLWLLYDKFSNIGLTW